jgi:hypothetical protein
MPFIGGEGRDKKRYIKEGKCKTKRRGKVKI